MTVEQFLLNRGALKLPTAVARGSRTNSLTRAQVSREKFRINRAKRYDLFEDSDFEDLFAPLRNQAPGVF